VDVVVLTALDLEYRAVRALLTGLHTHTDDNGTRYETGEIRGGHGRVALALTGPGNLAAAALTTRALTSFRP
jgi:nucleoside phosphorylase